MKYKFLSKKKKNLLLKKLHKRGLVITLAISRIVPHSFRLRHHSATPAWRNLKECGTLQPKFKMAETMIKPQMRHP